MDAVQAVSALAMALTVAWEDWVMSCCRCGSEAMSHMVRSEKWGEDTKMSLSQKPSVQLVSNSHSTFLRVSANGRWCHHIGFSITMPLQCYLYQHLHFGAAFWVEKRGKTVIQSIKNMKRYSLLCSLFAHQV